jgi:dUTP pyrophosphatase
MIIDIKKLHSEAIIPERAHPTDSGLDLFACLPDGDIVIPSILECEAPSMTLECEAPSITVPTGIAIALPEGYAAQVRPRSGLAFKHGVWCHLGTIDNGYRGEIAVLLYNLGVNTFTIKHGMKIAQLVIEPVFLPSVNIVDEFVDSTKRGTAGFGSTGQ